MRPEATAASGIFQMLMRDMTVDAAGIHRSSSLNRMSVVAAFENTFVRDLEGLYVPWRGAAVSEPRLLVLNEELAAELGLDPEALTPSVLAGDGAEGVAQVYAGHQFGAFSPRLGDGRAL